MGDEFPGSDYGALPSDGFGFLPNAPASGYVGTAVGVLRAVPPGGLSSTERRIVRTPKACPPGAASPCATLD
ncbi:MAG: hypothetical protein JNK04_07410 [Myxococcales bacterium]|nr:hypothetical protein [Myxococcales bacterium]